MKLQNLFMLALMAVAMFNCSSDDDSNDDPVTTEGTWRLTAMTTANAYDLNEDGTASNDFLAETNCLQNETLVFAADATGSINFSSYVDIELDLVVGSTDEFEYTLDCIAEVESYPLTWTRNGTTLTFIDDGEVYVSTVSGNTLTFVIEDGTEFESEDNGVIVTVEEDLTFVYTKQ